MSYIYSFDLGDFESGQFTATRFPAGAAISGDWVCVARDDAHALELAKKAAAEEWAAPDTREHDDFTVDFVAHTYTYAYSIFDCNPNEVSGSAWPTHTQLTLEADSDADAIDQASNGGVIGQPTYELTHEDLGVEPEPEYNGRIDEQGNGFPDIGDYVGNPDQLYRVVSMGRIETGRFPGAPNWCPAHLEPVDWDECSEGDEFPAYAVEDDK